MSLTEKVSKVMLCGGTITLLYEGFNRFYLNNQLTNTDKYILYSGIGSIALGVFSGFISSVRRRQVTDEYAESYFNREDLNGEHRKN